MNLKDFIARAVSYFDKAEPALAASAELTKALARVSELEAQATRDLVASETAAAEIGQLRADLEKAQGEVNAKGTEIKALQEKLAAEEKRVEATLAGMGIDPKKVPAAKAGATPGTASAGEKLLEQYKAIADSTERVRFYRANKAALDAAWK